MKIGPALFLIFLVAKLTGAITWPWWIVTAPAWVPWAMLALSLVLIRTGEALQSFAETHKRPPETK